MTAGRKPKPTALKLIAGNPGKRKIKGGEPKPEICTPEPPKHLTLAAVAEWHRLAPQLARLGLMSELDRAAFAMYCQSWARHVEAEQQIAKASALAFTHNGYPIVNPWVTISKQSFDMCRSLLSEFGLTPVARARMALDHAQSQDEDGKAFAF